MGKSPAGLKFPPGNGEEGKVLALLPSKPCEAMQQLHLLRQVHTPYTLSPNLPSGSAHPAMCHRTSVRSQGHPSKDLPGSPRAPGMDPSVFPMALLLQDPVVLSGGCLTPGRADVEPGREPRGVAGGRCEPVFFSGNLGDLPWCFPE